MESRACCFVLLLAIGAALVAAQTQGPRPVVDTSSTNFAACNDPARGANNTNGCNNGGTGNRGSNNTGTNNYGSNNQGSSNYGNFNIGINNNGSYNTGDNNVGFCNSGNNNVGNGLVGNNLSGKNPCPAGTRGGVSGTLFA